MPLEKDVQILRNFILSQMKVMVLKKDQEWDKHRFIKLRNLICTRLTLLNARRGGEPARMLLPDWTDTKKNAWIDPQLVQNISDPLEKSLLNQFKIVYQSGKGSRRLVPVLIPNDTVEPLRILAQKREQCGIPESNICLFPSTGSSKDHVSGWNIMKYVTNLVDGLERPELLIADKFRHRASTLFALTEVPEEKRHAFYKHMGHSQQINRDVYQCPLAVKEVTQVGKFLDTLDQETHETSETHTLDHETHETSETHTLDQETHETSETHTLDHETHETSETHTLDHETHETSETHTLDHETHETSETHTLDHETHETSETHTLDQETHETSETHTLDHETHETSETHTLDHETHETSETHTLDHETHETSETHTLDHETHETSETHTLDQETHETSETHTLDQETHETSETHTLDQETHETSETHTLDQETHETSEPHTDETESTEGSYDGTELPTADFPQENACSNISSKDNFEMATSKKNVTTDTTESTKNKALCSVK